MEKMYVLSIETPDEIMEIEICHTVINQDDENMWTTISTKIQEKKFMFQAETTEEVLIQLAKSLPKGWRLKSCLSCRYGHFCPVGNCDNELFCVTDFSPKEPCDLWHVTEDDEERDKRSRTLFELCDKYAPQSKDYFTYSDYYFEISNVKE